MDARCALGRHEVLPAGSDIPNAARREAAAGPFNSCASTRRLLSGAGHVAVQRQRLRDLVSNDRHANSTSRSAYHVGTPGGVTIGWRTPRKLRVPITIRTRAPYPDDLAQPCRIVRRLSGRCNMVHERGSRLSSSSAGEPPWCYASGRHGVRGHFGPPSGEADDVSSDALPREVLRFRDGTALGKLHLPAPRRNSEAMISARTKVRCAHLTGTSRGVEIASRGGRRGHDGSLGC